MQSVNCCSADEIRVGEWEWQYRGRPAVLKRAKKIYHMRGVERFWHWSDQVVVEPPTNL